MNKLDMFEQEWALSIQSNSRVCGGTRPVRSTAVLPPTLPPSRPRLFMRFSLPLATRPVTHAPFSSCRSSRFVCDSHRTGRCDHLEFFSLRRFLVRGEARTCVTISSFPSLKYSADAKK